MLENIHDIQSLGEIRKAYPIMKQLHPHIEDEQAFVEQIQRQFKQGHRLVSYRDQGEMVALAGFHFSECLAWGKVLYIEDLITDARARGKGYGRKLLKWMIELAKGEGCHQVHLDSGHHRHDAHRIYLQHGFRLVAHHVALTLG